jgi:hypothetical protein
VITVPISYTCHECGVNGREIQVRERSPDENIVDWMHSVQKAVGLDHMRASPTCRALHCDLKIPIASKKEALIGEAVRQ